MRGGSVVCLLCGVWVVLGWRNLVEHDQTDSGYVCVSVSPCTYAMSTDVCQDTSEYTCLCLSAYVCTSIPRDAHARICRDTCATMPTDMCECKTCVAAYPQIWTCACMSKDTCAFMSQSSCAGVTTRVSLALLLKWIECLWKLYVLTVLLCVTSLYLICHDVSWKSICL